MPESLEPWNWQQSEWPDFSYDATALRALEAAFLHRSGVHVGAFGHLGEEDREHVRAELLSDEALQTSRIEGEFLNRDSLQSSIRKAFGMQGDSRKVTPAEQGISELIVDVYRSINQCSPASATRDLSDLVEKGALARTGELKHARYFLKPS